MTMIPYSEVNGIDSVQKPRVLMSETPTYSLVIRWSENESAVLREATDKDEIDDLADLIRRRIRRS